MRDSRDRPREELLLDIQKLSARLAEAEETLRAIRSGEVDALVVTGAHGEQVFTLKGAEQPYRTLIEEMNEGAVMLAADDTVLYCNQGFARMLKTPLEKVIGTGIADFIQPAYKPVFEEILVQGRREGSKGETAFLAADGTPVPVHLSVNTLEMDGASTVCLVAMDLTEHKLTEEQLHEQAALLDRARDAIGVRDLQHRIIYWNRSAERMYGWAAEEAKGKIADHLLYKEESPGLTEAKKRAIEEGEWEGELQQITKHGKEIIVESRWTLVRDNEGNPRSILIINTDITGKKMLEAQLLRAQRMESIGTLAGGIAHDLNNILTPIMLSLQILRTKYTDEQSQKLLTMLEKNSQRGANLIKQVLSFARGIEGERNALQVTHIISEIEKTIKETFPRAIEIRTSIQNDLWTISGDSTQLHQVMMNLCVNARDAMPDGGTLGITASNFLVDETCAQMNAETKTGPYISISISDTGTGIPPGILNRIFEPFFTTKEFGKGTGLGLSTSLGIIRSHGGFIDVSSKVGKGTVFKIYLPASTADVKVAEVQQPVQHKGDGEAILVVDDEASIREVACATLEKNGYRVIPAEDGVEAISLYAKNKDDIKAVLMDMMMPVMDGHACIRALRKINPGIKIIAASGLIEKVELTKDSCFHAFLQKPFTEERLMRTVHEVLSAE